MKLLTKTDDLNLVSFLPFIASYRFLIYILEYLCNNLCMSLITFIHRIFQDQFQDKTPYTIMFGPDKCGEDYKVIIM